MADPRNQSSVRSAHDQRLIAGGSAPAPWVTFSCLSKRKSPKRKTPGRFAGLRPVPCASRFSRALANSPGAKMYDKTSKRSEQGYIFAPRAQTRARALLRLRCDARLAPTGFLKNPYGTRAHRKPLPASPKGRGQEARGRRAATGTSRRAAARQRREAQRAVVPSGACFLLVPFLCTSKERNSPAVRGTAINTPPLAARLKDK